MTSRHLETFTTVEARTIRIRLSADQSETDEDTK
jgi:hypothetical protein